MDDQQVGQASPESLENMLANLNGTMGGGNQQTRFNSFTCSLIRALVERMQKMEDEIKELKQSSRGV